LQELLGDPVATAFWTHTFDQAHAGAGSWDHAWLHACWTHGGLSALPTTNLVSNLGFRPDATHTKTAGDFRSPFGAIPTVPAAFPLTHPEVVEPDPATDGFLEEVVFSGNLRRGMSRVRQLRKLHAAGA
jgi:hypothetical protein